MAIKGSIGRRYARALIGAARDAGALAEVDRDLQGLAALVKESPELVGTLHNAAFPAPERKAALAAIAERLGAHAATRSFLALLVDKDRFDALPGVLRAYESLSDAAAGRVRATVTAAQELPDAVVEEIRARLERKTGKKVLIEKKADPAMLGGVVTQIGSTVYDGSVRTQIRRVRDQLLQRG